jgi:hypothetical protein
LSCDYCGVGQVREVDPAALARSLRDLGGSVETLFETLADRLARELPDLTRIERRGGLFSAKKIESVELGFPDHVFKIRREGGRLCASRAEVVRGIVVKTETLPADTWLEALCRALAEHARSSTDALAALRRIGAH